MNKSQIKRLETRTLLNKLRGSTPMPRMTKAELDARINAVVAKVLSGQLLACSEDDAGMIVLKNGIKVVIRKPSLWGSKAHQSV